MIVSSCYPICQSTRTDEKKSELSKPAPSLFSGISPLVSLAPPPVTQLHFARVTTLSSRHCEVEPSLWFAVPSVIDLLALLFSDFPTYSALCNFYKDKEYEAFFGVLLGTCHTLQKEIRDLKSPRRYDYTDIIYLYHLHEALKKNASHFFETHVTPFIENLLKDLTELLTSSQKGRLVRCLNLLHSESDTSADELRNLLRPHLYSVPSDVNWLSNQRVLSEVISTLTIEQCENNLPELQEALEYCQFLLNALTEGREIQLPKFWVASDKAALTPEEMIETFTRSTIQKTLSSPNPTQLVLLLSSTIEWLLPTSMKVDAASKLSLIVQAKGPYLLAPCIHAISFPNEDSFKQQKANNQTHKLELTLLSTPAVTLILEKLKQYVLPFTPLQKNSSAKRSADSSSHPQPQKRRKVDQDSRLFSITSSPPAANLSVSSSSNGVNGKSHFKLLYTKHSLFIPNNPHESIKKLLEFCEQEDSKQDVSQDLSPPEGKKQLVPTQLLALDPGMRFKMYESSFSIRRLLILAHKSPEIVQTAFKHGLFSKYPKQVSSDENCDASKQIKREKFFKKLNINFKDLKKIPSHRDIWTCYDRSSSFNPFLFVNYSSVQNVLFNLSAEIINNLNLDLKKETALEVFFTNLAYHLINTCKKKALNLYISNGSVRSFLIDHNTFDWVNPGVNFRQFPNEPVLIFKLVEQLRTNEKECLNNNLNPATFGQGNPKERGFLVFTLLKEMGKAIQNRYFLNPLPQFDGFPRRLSNLPLIKLLEGKPKEDILANKNFSYPLSSKDLSFSEEALEEIPQKYK